MTILNDDTIDAKLAESKHLVLKVTATWCTNCKTVGKILHEMDDEWEEVPFAEVDVDNCPSIVERYGINSLPKTFFIKEGEVVEVISGIKPRAVYENAVKKLVA